MKLDRYDRAIVRALQLDGRITNSQLAEGVNLSESACLRRVRALEESGFIEGYTALINQQKAGCPVNVFVNITLERQEQAHLHAFEEAARGELRGILEVSHEELVSSDFKSNPHSSIVDAPVTAMLGGQWAKVVSWYDNEWGFSCRMVDLTAYMAEKL